MIRRGAAVVLLAAIGIALTVTPVSSQERTESLRIPFPEHDGSLTPYTFEVGYQLMSLIYDTVMWRDAEGVPRPWLAESVVRSEDGRRVTIRLREGLRWQDGRPLTASDVSFTFDYVRDRPHPRFTPQLADVERVDVVDQRTVVIALRRPALGFFDQPLSDLPILPRHLWEGLPAGLVAPLGPPVGSGPYRLVDRRPGGGYTFQANPGYFRGRPLVDRIEVPIIRTADATLEALGRQEVDMVPASLDPSIPASSVGRGIRVAEGDSYTGTVLLFNLRGPPFESLAARRAVAQALDLDRISASVTGFGGGDAIPAERGYLHPASPWTPEETLHRFDQDASRVAFAELGLPPLRVLAPSSDPVRERIGQRVVAALSEAGAEADLLSLPFRRLAARIGLDGRIADFQLAIWPAPPLPSYDPAFLSALFGGDSPLNHGGYNSSRFDRLAIEVADAPTIEDRREAVRDELEQLARDLPVVPILYPRGAFAYAPGAYDDWIYVKGEGILDKRSFLPRDPAREEEGSEPIGSPLAADGGAGAGSWPWFVLGALTVLAIAGFAWYAASQRRRTQR